MAWGSSQQIKASSSLLCPMSLLVLVFFLLTATNSRRRLQASDLSKMRRAEQGKVRAPHQNVYQRALTRLFRPAQTGPRSTGEDWLQPIARPPSEMGAPPIGQLEKMAAPGARLRRGQRAHRGGGGEGGGGAAAAAGEARPSLVGGGRGLCDPGPVCRTRRK